jgi:hypothetical protein
MYKKGVFMKFVSLVLGYDVYLCKQKKKFYCGCEAAAKFDFESCYLFCLMF